MRRLLLASLLSTLLLTRTAGAALPVFVPLSGAANPLDGFGVGMFSAPALGDLDGDGAADLVAGAKDGALSYF